MKGEKDKKLIKCRNHVKNRRKIGRIIDIIDKS